MGASHEVLFQVHPDPMWICAPDTLRILAANVAAVAEYGYSAEAFVALTLHDLQPAPPAEAHAAARDETCWHQRHDRSLLQVDLRIRAVELQGEDVRLVIARTRPTCGTDTPLRAEGDEAARTLDHASRLARVSGWHVDVATQQVRCVRPSASINQRPQVDAVDIERQMQALTPACRTRLEAALRRCTERGIPFDEELQIETRVGCTRWVRIIGEAERKADGHIAAVHVAVQDVDARIKAQERIANLARRLQNTLENMSDAFYLLDRDWLFVYVNAEAARLLRRDAASLIGRSGLSEFPEAQVEVLPRFQQALDSGETVVFDVYYAPLKTWFSVRAHPTPEGVAVYFRDVTRERAEQQQLRLLRSAVSRQNDILLITEAEPIAAPDGPKIVYVNEAFERRTGYRADEVLGKTPRMLQGPLTSRAELDRIRAAMDNWQPVRAELINYTRAGTPFWLEIDIVPLADDSGGYTHWVAVERDVTERKRIEEQARQFAERFGLLSSMTNDVIWDWDLAEGTLWWNPNYEKLFGYDEAQRAKGMAAWLEAVHPQDRERVIYGIQALIESGGSRWEAEYRYLHADGRVRTVHDRGMLMRDADGTVSRMIGCLVDVTDQRELDERLRQALKLEAVGQLTGGIAHDFNNLLTVILGSAEVLAEQLSANVRLQQLAETCASAAQRGAELTHRLLAFARKQTLQPRRIDINVLLAGMDSLLRRTLGEHIEVEFARTEGLWPVQIDPGQLETAVLNLAINSRDAMPGGGLLTIRTENMVIDGGDGSAESDLRSGDYVLVAVCDGGTGMPPEVAARVFEPFFTTKDVGKGNGLGLPMVYGFTKQSGGHVRIISTDGAGTRVELYLPRSLGESESGLQAPALTVKGGSERILVVEDNALVREHLLGQLRSLGYHVDGAADGTQALKLLEGLPHLDLLLTDLVMPGGLNGRELAERVRALRPQLQVLFTSGYSEDAVARQDVLDPAAQMLSKPYRRHELARKVRSVLGARRRRLAPS